LSTAHRTLGQTGFGICRSQPPVSAAAGDPWYNRTERKVLVQKKATPTPWYLWPFVAIWRLLTWILGLTGRVLAVGLGLVLMIVGVVVSLTVVGAVVGIPLLIFGFLLIIRGLF
jgi:hypothetical protein